MNYLFLALACTLFSVQFIFTKSFSRGASSATHVGLWNGCVSALCAALIMFFLNGCRIEFNPSVIPLAIALALCVLAMSLCNIPAMRLGNLAVVALYLLVGGTVIPFVYGVLVLNEACSPLKIAAVILLVAAIVPNLLKETGNKQPESQGRGKAILFHLLGLILFTLNGTTCIITTSHSLHPDKISSGGFTMLWTFFQFALTLLVLIGYALYRFVKGERNAFRATLWDVGKETPTTPKVFFMLLGAGFGYAAANGVANIFSQESLAAGTPSSVQFPIISGVVIILTAFFAKWFFKEKIDRYTAVSLVLNAVGSVLFMFP